MRFLFVCFGTLILASNGCAHRPPSTADTTPPGLVATYHLGQDASGNDTVLCILSNTGPTPVLVSDRIMCDWHISPIRGTDGTGADGCFWFPTSAPLPAYLQLDPVDPTFLARGMIPDTCLRIPGKYAVGGESVRVRGSRLTLNVNVVVYRGSLAKPLPLTIPAASDAIPETLSSSPAAAAKTQLKLVEKATQVPFKEITFVVKE